MLLANRRLLAAKIESVYGTDPVPTGADALQVSNLDVSPAEAETVERNLIRPFFGQSERLNSQNFAKVDFEVELAGHGGDVVGNIPKLDALIRSCGFEGAQETTSISSITRVGAVATATIGAHNYKVGEKVSISGATEVEYNGEFTITAVTGTTFDFAVTGTPDTPATGTPIMKKAYVYTPISDAIPSVTFYYNVSGVLHKILGAKGTFSLGINVKNIPVLRFSFIGLTTPASDAAAFTPDFSDFTIPQVANTQNTTGFSLLGYNAALEKIDMDLAADAKYITLIGKEYVEIVNRKVTASMSFEAPTVAEKDFWGAIKAQTTGELEITHGTRNGNKVSLACPRVLLDSPKYQEMDNIMMMAVGVSVLPVDGNDEMTLKFE